MTPFAFDSPQQALAALLARLPSVETEEVGLESAGGRVLRQSIVADRDSPAADVSAMDGYAVRHADLQGGDVLPVDGESRPGFPPPEPCPRRGMQVFTGGIVPNPFDTVLRREDTTFREDAIELHAAAFQCPLGANIRRKGENCHAGDTIVAAGVPLSAASIAAAASFGYAQVTVSRPVRVAVIVTGDELCEVGQAVQPWQLRESNGHAVRALLQGTTSVELVSRATCRDELPAILSQLTAVLEVADAVVITGGVSVGDYDHVPAAVAACGAEVVFHRLPIRPGKPILGAVSNSGQLLLGLPGNPVSATVCAARFLLPALKRMAGQTEGQQPQAMLASGKGKSLPLWQMRLVQCQSDGNVRWVDSRGSGDLVALARSDGFIELPPKENGPGAYPFYRW